jgi:hypothetical protein
MNFEDSRNKLTIYGKHLVNTEAELLFMPLFYIYLYKYPLFRA